MGQTFADVVSKATREISSEKGRFMGNVPDEVAMRVAFDILKDPLTVEIRRVVDEARRATSAEHDMMDAIRRAGYDAIHATRMATLLVAVRDRR